MATTTAASTVVTSVQPPPNVDGSDDDDDDDEDYAPTTTRNESDGEGERSSSTPAHPNNMEQEPPSTPPRLTASKRKAVDDAFERLFGYPYGTVFQRKNANNQRSCHKKMSHQERIIVDIFGPTAAARLLKSSTPTFDPPPPKYDLPPLSLPSKQIVTEVKRFAGANITVQKTVVNASNSNASSITAPPEKKQGKGLDHVLGQLDGPSKLSTVAKTSSDWDTFKEKEGMEDELEKKAQGKDAFLVKKDFLDRVDHRQFEQERAQRDKERSARGK